MAEEFDDPRGPTQVTFDAIADQVRENSVVVSRLETVVEKFLQLHEGRNTQTVIHKTEGMGAWGAAAVTACFFTMLALVLFALVVLPDLHDIKAWQDIMRQKISKLEAGK